MTTVYLALGSNIGDSENNIAKTIELLQKVISDIKKAHTYRSKAVGYTDQPDFLNTAISGQTNLSPQELLEYVKEVEGLIGRIARFRWGPREIDVDIIFYGDLTLKTDGLTIPHASFSQRDFVLRPILDLNDQLLDPVSKRSLKNMLYTLDPSMISIIQ